MMLFPPIKLLLKDKLLSLNLFVDPPPPNPQRSQARQIQENCICDTNHTHVDNWNNLHDFSQKKKTARGTQINKWMRYYI